jgi:hypothetical protein
LVYIRKEDLILKMDVWRVSGSVGIFGLLVLGLNRDFLVLTTENRPWLDNLEDGDAGEGFFVECE